ncbi:DedA family protein [Streptomyces sp. NPDC002324]
MGEPSPGPRLAPATTSRLRRPRHPAARRRDAVNALSDILGHLSPAAAYSVVAAAVLAESILLVGAFVPTLTLLLTAGALARTGHIGLPLVIAAAAGAVVAGDFLAHRTGSHLGDRLRAGRVGRRVPDAAWGRAETLMTRHGGRAVFVARFLPVLRTLAPHCAGVTRLPYRRIAPYSVVAAGAWATVEAGAGYVAATSLQRVLTLGGPALALVALSALGGALVWRGRLRPRLGRTGASVPDAGSEGADYCISGCNRVAVRHGGARSGRPRRHRAVAAVWSGWCAWRPMLPAASDTGRPFAFAWGPTRTAAAPGAGASSRCVDLPTCWVALPDGHVCWRHETDVLRALALLDRSDHGPAG